MIDKIKIKIDENTICYFYSKNSLFKIINFGPNFKNLSADKILNSFDLKKKTKFYNEISLIFENPLYHQNFNINSIDVKLVNRIIELQKIRLKQNQLLAGDILRLENSNFHVNKIKENKIILFKNEDIPFINKNFVFSVYNGSAFSLLKNEIKLKRIKTTNKKFFLFRHINKYGLGSLTFTIPVNVYKLIE